MKRKSFIDTIDTETLASMIDTTLKYEKRQKSERGTLNMLKKIIPAAAMVLFIVVIANIEQFTNTGSYNDGHTINDVNISDTNGRIHGGTQPVRTTPSVTQQQQDNQEVKAQEENTDNHAIHSIRFGEEYGTLLLDVEWYTAETWLERGREQVASLIADGKWWLPRTINGLSSFGERFTFSYTRSVGWRLNENGLISHFLFGEMTEEETAEFLASRFDENGYYIYRVYPIYRSLSYTDENGDEQILLFGTDLHETEWGSVFGLIHSKAEFDYLMENEIIPYLDDLLERGLLGGNGFAPPQVHYDWLVRDPMERAIERFFGAVALEEFLNYTAGQ